VKAAPLVRGVDHKIRELGMRKRILISVGSSVGVCAVDEDGQCNGTGLNEPGQTLRSTIQRYEGDLILVRDCLFGTGYHRVVTGCGAGGVGWTFRLEPFASAQQEVDAHTAMVQEVKEGKPVGRSFLSLVFDRLEGKRPHGVIWDETSPSACLD
jgi:hypothetical protein